MDERDDARIARSIYSKILYRNFFPKIKKEVAVRAKRLKDFSRKLQKTEYGSLSERELGFLYGKFCQLFLEMRMYSSLPTAMEHMSNTWSQLLSDILAKRNLDQKSRNTSLATLTSPLRQSYISEYEDLVAELALKNFSGLDIRDDINAVLDRFAWVHYTAQGDPLTREDVLEKIRSWGSAANARSFLDEQNERIRDLRRRRRQLKKELRLSKHEASLFDIGADIVFIKFFRKGIFSEAYYSVEFLFAEIGRRIGISRSHVANMFPNEVLAALAFGTFPAGLIEARLKESCIFAQRGRTYPIDKNAKAAYDKALAKGKEPSGIRGQVAFAGRAQGKAKIINVPADMKKMVDGDVLVSRSTNPSLISAMHIASAFITDIGGLTCHAAIVARELKKPCIVGTKTATKVINDGDLLEVDADNGIVKILSEK
ncbi:MAG: hypothetical protein JO026_03305 [Patescibacteria group bacterium]|nr:hypothetical protein [Patescibacteria group bacterium]